MALTDLGYAKPSLKQNRANYLMDVGLFLLVKPNGGKWWRFKYRFDSKEKQLSLGVYPDVSLKDARDRRNEARKSWSPMALTQVKTAKLKKRRKEGGTALKLWHGNGSPNTL